ncbi:hypothetical protein PVNG_05385 [Plasmodium vivax North Korean]|uniref:Uncharacterized protein n=1 Tax=Plasmodium vivax North Korean TaxID=1035514 RepID=A0A0J9TXP2_PLAVI|nr:hypothetical protein PVNG_05385 [Plasmodium vivax North Korean]
MAPDAAEKTVEPKCNTVNGLQTWSENEKEVNKIEGLDKLISVCEKIKTTEQEWNEEIKKVCKKLMKYFFYWSKYKTDSTNTTTNNKIANYIEYLNYLLNDKLRTNEIPVSDRLKAYADFKNIIAEQTNLNDLKDKIYYIKEEYYKNMKTMYELYEIFYKIKNIKDSTTDEQNKCSDYVNNCVKKYEEFQDICYVQEHKDKEQYKKLCGALREFKVLYKINRYYQKSCESVELPKLPEFKKPNVETVIKKLEKFKECSTTAHKYSVDNNEEKYEKGILEQLDEYKYYENFNIEEYSPEDNEYCPEIEKSIDDKCEYNILCTKIATNLKKLHIMNDKKDNKERCLYFTYWLYDKISKMFSNNSKYIVNIPDIHNLFDVIYKINRKFEEKDKCHVDYRHKAKVGELKEMKHMHDYFMVFKSLKKHSPCKKEYKQTCCDYVQHINRLYKKYIGNCCTCYFRSNECHNNCDDYFNCHQDYNPYKLYEEFECEKLGDNEKGFEKLGTPTAIDYYFIHLRSLRPQCNSIFCDLFYVAVLSAFSVLGLFLVFFIFYKVGEISH